MAALVEQKEKRINELKQKKANVQDAISEVQQLKAARKQMILQNKQTYEELQTEFTGRKDFGCLPLSNHQNLMSNWNYWKKSSTRNWRKLPSRKNR